MRCVLYLGMIATLALASSALAQDFASGDWSMSCDVERYCIARANGSDGMQLKIERSKKPGSDVFVTVRLDEVTPMAEGMRVDIDVLDNGYSETATISRVYKGNEMTFAGGVESALLDALRVGNHGQVTVKFGGSLGTRVYDVSLRGITPALAAIDHQQARDDRTDAIVLRGGIEPGASDRQAAAAPTQAAPIPKPIAPKPALFAPALYGNTVYEESELPDEVLMTGYRVLACDFPYVLEGYGAQVVGVTQGLELWMVPCNPADVNVDYYISFHSDDATDFYEFKIDPRQEGSAALVVNPQWNNETRQLTTWSYYGPDGDCGSFATYQYVTEDDAFDMVAFREKEACDGVLTLAENYPLVWSQ